MDTQNIKAETAVTAQTLTVHGDFIVMDGKSIAAQDVNSEELRNKLVGEWKKTHIDGDRFFITLRNDGTHRFFIDATSFLGRFVSLCFGTQYEGFWSISDRRLTMTVSDHSGSAFAMYKNLCFTFIGNLAPELPLFSVCDESLEWHSTVDGDRTIKWERVHGPLTSKVETQNTVK